MIKRITLEELAGRAMRCFGDIYWLENGIERKIIAIKQLKVGEEVVVATKPFSNEKNNILSFQRYIGDLNEGWKLNIGERNCEYLYKTPTPESHNSRRELILYKKIG